MSQKPLFRADHVGSLLRPLTIKDARKMHFEDKTAIINEL